VIRRPHSRHLNRARHCHRDVVGVAALRRQRTNAVRRRLPLAATLRQWTDVALHLIQMTNRRAHLTRVAPSCVPPFPQRADDLPPCARGFP
jgi:hypothetical protein